METKLEFGKWSVDGGKKATLVKRADVVRAIFAVSPGIFDDSRFEVRDFADGTQNAALSVEAGALGLLDVKRAVCKALDDCGVKVGAGEILSVRDWGCHSDGVLAVVCRA